MTELGKWIKSAYGSQEAFAAELGIQQSRVSKWLKGDSIPGPWQERIRGLRFKGRFPRQEGIGVKDAAQESQDAQAGGPASYVTREEMAELRGRLEGRIERLEAAFEKLGELVRDLVRESEESRPRGPKE